MLTTQLSERHSSTLPVYTVIFTLQQNPYHMSFLHCNRILTTCCRVQQLIKLPELAASWQKVFPINQVFPKPTNHIHQGLSRTTFNSTDFQGLEFAPCKFKGFPVKPRPPATMQLRTHGHDFELPIIKYEFNKRNFIVQYFLIMYDFAFYCIIFILYFIVHMCECHMY